MKIHKKNNECAIPVSGEEINYKGATAHIYIYSISKWEKV